MYALMTSVVLVNGSCVAILFAFCRPSNAFWDITNKDAKCWDTKVLSIASSVQGCELPAAWRQRNMLISGFSTVYSHGLSLHINSDLHDLEAPNGNGPKGGHHDPDWLWFGDDRMLHRPLAALCEQ
jgi:hypothetical protein